LLSSLAYTDTRMFKNTVIIGWNVEAAGLYDRIISTPALGYNVRGFINPNGFKEKSHYKNVPVLGDIRGLKEIKERLDISNCLIVLSPIEKQFLSAIVKECNRLLLDYRIVSDTFDDHYDHIIRDVIKDVLHTQNFGFRRIIDCILAFIMLLLLFPLFLLTAVIIKLESNGPVFYSQQRYGWNGRIFAVHKFRSMVQDAEKISGPVWAQKSDPRITKIGRFMRKTRIDELPQLINILKGDMSFIGPRPERPFFADTFKTQIPLYMNRLKVRPGITGLAQITVGYDETLEDVKDKVNKDLEYIQLANKWSMNFYILMKTIKTVFALEGQ
jgi:exopolysaccharide biosynthesis polyprenyl glycosylphosphotransferase